MHSSTSVNLNHFVYILLKRSIIFKNKIFPAICYFYFSRQRLEFFKSFSWFRPLLFRECATLSGKMEILLAESLFSSIKNFDKVKHNHIHFNKSYKMAVSFNCLIMSPYHLNIFLILLMNFFLWSPVFYEVSLSHIHFI